MGRGGFGNIRGGFQPHGRGGGRGRGRGFPRGGHHFPINKGNDRQEMMQLNTNLNQQMNNIENQYMLNDNNMKRITVEGENLLETIKEKLKIEDDDEKTEAVGETLFYFLIKFIPQYGLNTTNGKYNDSDLCSKLTGILIKTEPNILLQIISSTQSLYSSLKDVLIKLTKGNE